MIHTLKLRDGSTVKIDTEVSIKRMQEFEKAGLITERMIASMMKMLKTNEGAGRITLKEAPMVLYVSYLNAENEGRKLDKDEFFSLVTYNFGDLTTLYAELLGSTDQDTIFVDEIKKATDTGKNQGGGKESPNSNLKTS